MLLAGVALDAMRTRNIGVGAFRQPDRQGDALRHRRQPRTPARASTAEADRQEAARIQAIAPRRSIGATASQSEFLTAIKDAKQQSADLAAKRDDLQKQIAELQAAAAESEAESKKRSGVFGWIKNAASAVGDKFRDMKLDSRTAISTRR